MSKLKPRRILAVLGLIILVVGGYAGWQVYKGQQLAKQYAAEAQKQAQGSDLDPTASNPPTPGSEEGIGSAETQPNSDVSSSGTPVSEDYKQLMAKTHQQTLQTMQKVKANTLALQGKKLSLSAYKASIVQSQATFSAAEAFVRENPPTDATLKSAYQEFLAGISLAKESMGVVLNGISSFSPSKIYAARDMGETALKQVTSGYAKF